MKEENYRRRQRGTKQEKKEFRHSGKMEEQWNSGMEGRMLEEGSNRVKHEWDGGRARQGKERGKTDKGGEPERRKTTERMLRKKDAKEKS